MINILSGEELLRWVMHNNALPTMPIGIYREQQTIAVGQKTYSIMPGVIERLIDESWLIQVEDRYQFDFERSEEWQGLESQRIQRAEKQLRAHYQGSFVFHAYGVLEHPQCAEHNTRGYVFRDAQNYSYLVTIGGKASCIPELI